MLIPTLTTGRLLLRRFHAGDWDAFAAMNADPQVRRWLGGRIMSRNESWTQMEAILGQWALRGYGMFAVEVDGRFAGRVGLLHPADWVEPELAWTIASPFWGRGLATEAARRTMDWAVEQFRWHRLVSYIVPDNRASRRVAEKLGAVANETIMLRGHVADLWLHRIPAPTASDSGGPGKI